MPLPRARYPKVEDFPDDLTDYIKENEEKWIRKEKQKWDRMIPEEVIIDDALEYIGDGAYGFVLRDRGNKVYKFTTDNPMEIRNAERILEWQKENGRFHPNIIGIHDIVEIPNSEVVYLVTERLVPLESHLKYVDSYFNANNIPESEWPELKMKMLQKLKNELLKKGLSMLDLHYGNIGFREGSHEPIVLDMGLLNIDELV
jgi:hypothetical protein